jgi:polysaccharide deacetylase 2 family uncharacterized protein YibQ
MLGNIPLSKRLIWLVAGLTLAAGIIILALILICLTRPLSDAPGSRVLVSLSSTNELAPKDHKLVAPSEKAPLPITNPVEENQTLEGNQTLEENQTLERVSVPPLSDSLEDPSPASDAEHRKIITLKPTIKLNNTSPVFNPDNKKQMAIVLTDLGLQSELFKKILEDLDPAVTLAFYGCVESTPHQMLEARRRGHELVVMIPMEPYNYPANDPGPDTLLTGSPAEENLRRLDKVLAPLSGYVAVINYLGGRFTASAVDYEPIIVEFKRRNLLLLDHFSAPRSLAQELGSKHQLPVLRIKKVLKNGLSREEIIRQLDNFAYLIDEQEVAVILVHTYPEAVEALKEWTAHIKEKPVALVPISAIALTP